MIQHHKLFFFIIILIIVGACTPTDVPRETVPIFPTITVGAEVGGRLPSIGARPSDFSNSALSNPATVVALSNVATPTPDFSECPTSSNDVTLEPLPSSRAGISLEIERFLSQGGTSDELERQMLANWDIFSDLGYYRDNVDLTGEGEPEIVVGFTTPEGVGTLAIFGCFQGRYIERYLITSDDDTPPELIWLGDMNNAEPAEVVFIRRQCVTAETCELETQIIGWNPTQARVVNLLDESLLTLDKPRVSDTDLDEVAELIVDLENRGTSATGPLRTGVNIYDWNGSSYTLSIIQLDPPRYHIQVIHEADRLFLTQNYTDSVTLFTQSLSSETLRYWFNDGASVMGSYALYRSVLANAVLDNVDELTALVETLNAQYEVTDDVSLADLPVYVEMAYAFINTLIDSNNDLHLACLVSLEIADEREEALTLLNRYGSRSPTYTRLDLCPF